VCYVNKLPETVLFPQNCSCIYIQIPSTAKSNLLRLFKCKYHKLKRPQICDVIKRENGNVCEAPYEDSYHIAYCGEVCAIVENLFIPYVEGVDSFVLGNDHLNVIRKQPAFKLYS
jgi:hypothetical protein